MSKYITVLYVCVGPTCCVGGCCGGMAFDVLDPENENVDLARIKKAGAAEVGLRR